MTRTSAGAAQVADLSDKPGFLIRRAHQITASIFEAAAGDFDVTPAQHVIMTAVFKRPGIDQATLAARVALDKVTVGQVVTRLERRGLLARVDSPADRRAWKLSLTPAGSRLLQDMQPAVRRSQVQLLAPLSPAQRRQFYSIMRRLAGMTPPYRPAEE